MSKNIKRNLSKVGKLALCVIIAIVMSLGVIPTAQSAVASNTGDQPQLFAGADDINVYAASKKFTGWKKSGKKICYYKNGKKANGFKTIKGKTYYFKKGVSQKGFLTIKDKTYYFKKAAKGKYTMAKGLTKVGKSKYYFKKSSKNRHVMHTGFRVIKTPYYRWNKKGKLITKYKKLNYYFDTDGKMVVANSHNGHVLEVGGKYYYVHSDGSIDAKEKILYFERFKNGAWIRVIEDTDKYGNVGGRVMIRFGGKKLDEKAHSVLDAILDADNNDPDQGIIPRELYTELFRYKWSGDDLRCGFVITYARRYIKEYQGIHTLSGTYWIGVRD